MRILLTSFLVIVLLGTVARAQAPAPPTFRDDLLDHFVGDWKATGTIGGKPTHQTFTAEWTLNHMFFRVHQKEDAAEGTRAFEAIFYFSYDPAEKKYVVSMLTIFGAANSPTGVGQRNGNELTFTFQRPNGAIVYTFAWLDESRTWRITAANGGKPFVDLSGSRK